MGFLLGLLSLASLVTASSLKVASKVVTKAPLKPNALNTHAGSTQVLSPSTSSIFKRHKPSFIKPAVLGVGIGAGTKIVNNTAEFLEKNKILITIFAVGLGAFTFFTNKK